MEPQALSGDADTVAVRLRRQHPETRPRAATRGAVSEVLSGVSIDLISGMDDMQNLFKTAISEFMENCPEAEPNNELVCNKYDYKNKDADNRRSGHNHKTL